MRRTTETLLAAGLAGAIGASVGDARAAEDKPPSEGSETTALSETGLYVSGDAATRALLQKLENGEWKVIPDYSPAPVTFVGGADTVRRVMSEQGLRLDGQKIVSAFHPEQSNEWGIVIVDQSGQTVMESKFVQLSVSADNLVVTVVNSDGSLDRMVYDDGAVTSAEHLILSSVK